MNNGVNGTGFRRTCSFFLVLALLISTCTISVFGQRPHATVPFIIDDISYDVEMQFVNDELYCRADQWAQAAGCLWKINSSQNNLYFYTNTSVILDNYTKQEYITDENIPWVPFLDAANQTGVYFSKVTQGTVHGHRAKPLAVFYANMDRMFGISKYRITELILSMGDMWTAVSTISRGYAILSSMSISGFVDAVSGKMDQDIYADIFVDLLRTDERLLGVITSAGKDISKGGKLFNLLQKSLDEGSALLELFEKMGFSESEIRNFVWSGAQGAYGDNLINDLSDLYSAEKATKLWDALKLMDDVSTSIEADTHLVLAMQEVFADSDSAQIRHAVQKAIGARTGSKALALGTYSLEYLGEYFTDKAIGKFEEAIEESKDITNLEKLKAEIFVQLYDKTLALTDKSNAVMYSEVYSQLQLKLASYYYDHCNDDTPENGVMMHSVALLYLKACLAAYKLYEFDNSISQHIDLAKTTIEAEIANLMTYTEEELLQNGTSKECSQEISRLVNSKISSTQEEPNGAVSENFIGSWYSYTDIDGTTWEWHVAFEEDGNATVTLGIARSEYIAWFEGQWTQNMLNPNILTLNLTGGDLEDNYRIPNTKHTVTINIKVEGNYLSMHAIENGESVYILYGERYERG